MSIGLRKRLKKLETSLTPQQAVLQWMAEAHQFDSLSEHFDWLAHQPRKMWPLNRLADQVSASVQQSAAKEDISEAKYQAILDAFFLFFLHYRVNERALEIRKDAPLLAEVLAAMVESERGEDFQKSYPVVCRRIRDQHQECTLVVAVSQAVSDRYFVGQQVLFSSHQHAVESELKSLRVIIDCLGAQEDQAREVLGHSDVWVERALEETIAFARSEAFRSIGDENMAFEVLFELLAETDQSSGPVLDEESSA